MAQVTGAGPAVSVALTDASGGQSKDLCAYAVASAFALSLGITLPTSAGAPEVAPASNGDTQVTANVTVSGVRDIVSTPSTTSSTPSTTPANATTSTPPSASAGG